MVNPAATFQDDFGAVLPPTPCSVPVTDPRPAVHLPDTERTLRQGPSRERMAWPQGEVEVAVLLSVSLVREMGIQLPLSNLTGLDLVEKTTKEASNCSPSDPPSGSLKPLRGLMGHFMKPIPSKCLVSCATLSPLFVDRNRLLDLSSTTFHLCPLWSSA